MEEEVDLLNAKNKESFNREPGYKLTTVQENVCEQPMAWKMKKNKSAKRKRIKIQIRRTLSCDTKLCVSKQTVFEKKTRRAVPHTIATTSKDQQKSQHNY